METHSFNVDIAKKYGIVEAILLQNICFWIAKNIANNKNFYDGNYWTYNSLEAFMLLFPYLSEKKIRNAIKNLEDKKIIKTGNYNKNNYDRTKWYAIIDEKILSEIGLNSHTAKRANGFGERANGFVQKGRPIPDIKTDIKTDIKHSTITSNEVSQIIEYFNSLFSTKFRVTPERSKKIKLRLKTYSLDEIKKAIYNLSKSKFHNGENDRGWRATIDFITRNDEKIDEFLNSSPAKTEDIIITKKPYFMGKPLSKDMKFVIWSKGDIREFAGNKEDIIWK